MRRFLPFLLLVFIFNFCNGSEKKGNFENDPLKAPEFTLKELRGTMISLSTYKGKIIFLNFWATWCPPCRAEIPGFIEIFNEYKEKGLQIIGVSVDEISPEKVLEFVNEYRVNYPVVMGTPELYSSYKPGRAIPVTFIIDKEGMIRHKHIGYMDKDTLKNYFNQLNSEN